MWLALVLAAHAQTCDAKALQKQVVDAAPNATAKAYVELAACDAAAARAAAPDAFKKILSGADADAAILAAVKVGASQVVRDWLPAQQPDERSAAIDALGGKCDVKEVPTFFLETEKALGEKFWTDRWYAGLDECRDPAVRALLEREMVKPTKDPIRFKKILETYSRNLGPDAIPALKKLATEQKDPEVATYVVESFADAAGVGGEAGTTPAVTQAAANALVEVAPALPEKAQEKARQTLLALGAEAESDKLVAVRYKDRLQADGGLLYGVAVAEVATCKKGDKRVLIHHAQVLDSGHTWPDQVKERIESGLPGAFQMRLAEACKGTGTNEIVVSEAPLKDSAAYKAWADEQTKAFQKTHADVKPKAAPTHDPLRI